MKFVSFNVNGIRARLHQLEALVEAHQPDVIGLQETKVTDDLFPLETVEQMGYSVYFHGQKGHYGVALMVKQPAEMVYKGFPHDGEEAQKRLIAATLTTPHYGKIHILNGYFPQGENREHEVKFPMKEKFYRDLNHHLQNEVDASRTVVMGDFNIAPEDTDIGIGEENRKRWLRTGKCSFLPEEREWMSRLMDLGFKDGFRLIYPDVADRFSWFDYRSRGFERDPKRGLRIDMVLLGTALAPDCQDAGIDYEIRGMQKPSDHAPVWVELTKD